MPTIHAKLSASGAHRWLACPGSIEAESSIKDRTSSFAEEGTCAHELGEICLRDRHVEPIDFLGKTLNDAPSVTVDDDMVRYINSYIDYCTSFETDTSVSLVEERVDFSPWVPEGFGTSDFIIIDGDVCHVIDLKYGMGKKVYAEDNPQAQLYALGVLNDYGMIYDFTRIVMHIYQPRIHHVDEWEISVEQLMVFGEWVKGRAALCLEPGAEREAGESQCQFCKAKATCPTLASHIDSVIGSEFEDLDKNDVSAVDVAHVLKNKSLIEGWLKAVEAYAHETIMSGGTVPGYKLVAGRSLRSWSNEKLVVERLADQLGDDLYTKKVITVAQAEKVIGKKAFAELSDELVVKPEGKPTLAPDSDRRPALKNIEEMFESL
jgi:hypothetical protein